MKRITRIIIIATIIVMIFGAISTFAANKITWKIKKAKHGYVTRFYDEGKCVCKIKTKKKLPVRMYREDELNFNDLYRRYNKYILVERIDGECINSDGDGITDCGQYISYKSIKHKEGRKYTTFCIYRNNRYCDDVKTRIDKVRK